MGFLSAKELGELNATLDKNLHKQPLLQLSLDSALCSLFLFLEILPKQARKTQDMISFDAVKICVYWIYEYCGAATPELVIDMNKAQQLFISARNYGQIWNLLSGSFDKKKMTKLYQVEDDAGIFSFTAINPTKHAKSITENLCHDKFDLGINFDDLQQRCQLFLTANTQKLMDEAVPKYDTPDMFYMNEPIAFCKLLSNFLHSNFSHAWNFDPTWDFGGYTAADFRSAMEALMSQVKARRIVHDRMIQQHQGASFAQALLPIAAKNTFVHNLHLITGLGNGKLEKIIDDMTLRKGHVFKLDDIPHMPFFELSNGQICWSLFFTEYMQPELSIWRVLNIIRNSDVDKYKRKKEKIQIHALQEDLFNRAGFDRQSVICNIQVPKPYDSEIDMLLLDEKDKFGIVVQLKWVVPPIAIKNYHTDFDELSGGLLQADKCLRWIMEQPQEAALKLSISQSLLKACEIKSVVVGRNSMAKGRLEDAEHPVINELIMRWYLLEKKVSLREFWNSVKQNLYFVENYTLEDSELLEFDGFKFIGKNLTISKYPDFGPEHLKVWKATGV